jgi:CheY-like chemotaxis protein
MMGDTPAPESLKRTAEFSPGETPFVLMLDDDWDICESVREVLEEAGITAVCLTDGMQGLDYLLRAEVLPAAILLDLMMPGMDGWTFFDRIRAEPRLRDIPVIVLTAAGPHWGYPVTRVLRKPIDGQDLVAAVRAAAAVSYPAAPAEPARPASAADRLQAIKTEIESALTEDGELGPRTVLAFKAVLRLLDAVIEHDHPTLHEQALRIALDAIKEMPRKRRSSGR